MFLSSSSSIHKGTTPVLHRNSSHAYYPFIVFEVFLLCFLNDDQPLTIFTIRSSVIRDIIPLNFPAQYQMAGVVNLAFFLRDSLLCLSHRDSSVILRTIFISAPHPSSDEFWMPRVLFTPYILVWVLNWSCKFGFFVYSVCCEIWYPQVEQQLLLP